MKTIEGYSIEKIESVKKETKRGRGAPAKFPLHAIKRGYAMFVPNETIDKISPIVTYYKKRHGVNFSCRTVQKGKQTGVLIQHLKNKRETVLN